MKEIFSFPNYLWFFIYVFVLLAIVARWIPKKRKRLLEKLILKENLLKELVSASDHDLRNLKNWIYISAVFLAVAALAGPQWGLKNYAAPQLKGNLVIALDVSDSMLAEDTKPNRLERSKLEIIDAFITSQKTKQEPFRMGLVTFAGKAYLQCPLTLDTSALRYILQTVTAGSLPYAGTQIGSALKVAEMILAPAGGTKHILLVTDGEDHGSDIKAIAQNLAKAHIHVSTLWVGNAQGEPIPLKNDEGKFLGYKKDKNGTTVLSKAKGDSLQVISQLTGGKFINLNTEINIQSKLQEILEGGFDKKDKGMQALLENRFQIPLALSFFLLLMEWLMPERKINYWKRASAITDILAKEPSKRGTAGKSHGTLILVYLLIALACVPLNAASWKSLTRKGALEYKKGHYESAAKAFTQAKEIDPGNPAIHFNSGCASYKLNDSEGAVQAFEKSAELDENESAKSASYYNLGNAYMQKEETSQAIESYKRAILLNPKDSDAKHNLAIALRQKNESKQKDKKQENPNSKNDQNQPERKDGKENETMGQQEMEALFQAFEHEEMKQAQMMRKKRQATQSMGEDW